MGLRDASEARGQGVRPGTPHGPSGGQRAAIQAAGKPKRGWTHVRTLATRKPKKWGR